MLLESQEHVLFYVSPKCQKLHVFHVGKREEEDTEEVKSQWRSVCPDAADRFMDGFPQSLPHGVHILLWSPLPECGQDLGFAPNEQNIEDKVYV